MTYLITTAELRNRNTSKACEECRRRKQKCNGQNPCNLCRRRGASCNYRAVTRKRVSRAVSPRNVDLGCTQSKPHCPRNSHDDDEPPPVVTETDMDRLETSLPRKYIFNSIRATHVTRGSPSSLSELSFGPTSNFSVLRHFHTHFDLTDVNSSSPPKQPLDFYDGNESIDMFGFRDRAFGSLPSQQDLDSSFLRYELARSFLDSYLNTTHYHVPIVSAESLQSLLARLYEPDTGSTLSTSDRAITYVTMAIGATNEHDGWRSILFAKAAKEAEKTTYEINLRVVQVELLLISKAPPLSFPIADLFCLRSLRVPRWKSTFSVFIPRECGSKIACCWATQVWCGISAIAHIAIRKRTDILGRVLL
jgi:hypothetical protein